MEDKKYGVKTHLIEEFKQLQIKRVCDREKKMSPFIGYASLHINNGDLMICRIEAENGILSITPFPLFPQGLIGLELPQQNPIHLDPQSVIIELDPHLRVTLIFDTQNEKTEFITKLGGQSSSSSPSSGSNPDSVSRAKVEICDLFNK